jgi:hypothetical protein
MLALPVGDVMKSKKREPVRALHRDAAMAFEGRERRGKHAHDLCGTSTLRRCFFS